MKVVFPLFGESIFYTSNFCAKMFNVLGSETDKLQALYDFQFLFIHTGRDTFSGKSFHTARWPKDYSVGGNVAVIGTGASAVQERVH